MNEFTEKITKKKKKKINPKKKTCKMYYTE